MRTHRPNRPALVFAAGRLSIDVWFVVTNQRPAAALMSSTVTLSSSARIVLMRAGSLSNSANAARRFARPKRGIMPPSMSSRISAESPRASLGRRVRSRVNTPVPSFIRITGTSS